MHICSALEGNVYKVVPFYTTTASWSSPGPKYFFIFTNLMNAEGYLDISWNFLNEFELISFVFWRNCVSSFLKCL